jgi:hypothetical protein
VKLLSVFHAVARVTVSKEYKPDKRGEYWMRVRVLLPVT